MSKEWVAKKMYEPKDCSFLNEIEGHVIKLKRYHDSGKHRKWKITPCPISEPLYPSDMSYCYEKVN